MSDGSVKIEVDILKDKAEKELDNLVRIVEEHGDVIDENLKLDADNMVLSVERAKSKVEDLTETHRKATQELERYQNLEIKHLGLRQQLRATDSLDPNYDKLTASLERAGRALDRLDHSKITKEVERSKKALDNSVVSYEMLTNRAGKLTNRIQDSVDKSKELEGNARKTRRELERTSQLDITSGISKGIRTLGRYAGALFGIRTAYNLVRNLSNEWLNSESQAAQQAKANIQAMTSMLANALAPVIIWVTNLLGTMFGYLAAILKYFFGIDLSANSTAKATKGTSKNTSGIAKNTEKARKEADKFLASFDKAEVVSSNMADNIGDTGSGGTDDGIGGDVLPNLDLEGGKIIEWLNKIKKAISDAWNNPRFQAYLDDWKRIAVTTFEFIASIAGNLWRNIYETWMAMLPNLKKGFWTMVELHETMIRDLADAWEEWAPVIAESINNFVDNIYETFRPFFILVSEIWRDTWQIMLDIWNEYGADILDGIFEFINGMVELFDQIWTNIISPILEPAIQFMSDMWHDHLKDLIFEIGSFVASFVESALEILNKVVLPIIKWLTKLLKPVITAVFGWLFDFAKVVFGAVADFAKVAFQAIRGALEGLTDFIVGVFTGDWKRAWEGIKKIFSTIWSAIVDLLSVFWNLIIGIVKSGIQLFTSLFTAMWETVKFIWNTGKNIVVGIMDDLRGNIGRVIGTIKDTVVLGFNRVKDDMTRIMTNAFNSVKYVIDRLKNVFANVVSYLRTGFTNGWRNAMNGVKSITQSIANVIGNMFKMPINTMIIGLNAFIRGLNRIKLPSWVPGVGGLGINIPTIPRLARGTYANSGSLQAIIGESGKEAVVPLENNTGWIHDFINLFNEHGGGSGGGNTTVKAVVDGKTLFEVNTDEERKNSLLLNGGMA